MSSAARVVLTRASPAVRAAHHAAKAAPRSNPLPYPSVFLDSIGSPALFKSAPRPKQSGSTTYSVYLDTHFQNCHRA